MKNKLIALLTLAGITAASAQVLPLGLTGNVTVQDTANNAFSGGTSHQPAVVGNLAYQLPTTKVPVTLAARIGAVSNVDANNASLYNTSVFGGLPLSAKVQNATPFVSVERNFTSNINTVKFGVVFGTPVVFYGN